MWKVRKSERSMTAKMAAAIFGRDTPTTRTQSEESASTDRRAALGSHLTEICKSTGKKSWEVRELTVCRSVAVERMAVFGDPSCWDTFYVT